MGLTDGIEQQQVIAYGESKRLFFFFDVEALLMLGSVGSVKSAHCFTCSG
jgi:hypothetical protein